MEVKKNSQSVVKSLDFNYNDVVSVTEFFDLLDRMAAQKNTRFPASAVFHRALRNEKKEAVALASSICVTARIDEKLIGFLRIIGDQVYILYILDAMVDPDWQGTGVGRTLVEMVKDKAIDTGFMKLFLTAIPGSESFYESIGFKSSMSSVLTMRGEDFQKVES